MGCLYRFNTYELPPALFSQVKATARRAAKLRTSPYNLKLRSRSTTRPLMYADRLKGMAFADIAEKYGLSSPDLARYHVNIERKKRALSAQAPDANDHENHLRGEGRVQPR